MSIILKKYGVLTVFDSIFLFNQETQIYALNVKLF